MSAQQFCEVQLVWGCSGLEERTSCRRGAVQGFSARLAGGMQRRGGDCSGLEWT